MIVAKVVRSDGKLAIQLPAGFEIHGSEVSVRRSGETVILEPISPVYSRERVLAWLDQPKEPLDADFVAAMNEDPGPPEDRDFRLLD